MNIEEMTVEQVSEWASNEVEKSPYKLKCGMRPFAGRTNAETEHDFNMRQKEHYVQWVEDNK